MRTVKEINAPNSVTGSGANDTGFLGLKALFRFLGFKKNVATRMQVIQGADGGFFLADENTVAFAGPYKRKQDAKGVLTRLKNKHIG